VSDLVIDTRGLRKWFGPTLAVADDCRRPTAARCRCRRPELPGFFVTKIDHLARRIADRVVAPGSEAVHLAVICPGITAAGFGHQATDIGTGEHVAPGGRWPLAAAQRNDVLPAVGCESAQAVVEEQALASGRWRFGSNGGERSRS